MECKMIKIGIGVFYYPKANMWVNCMLGKIQRLHNSIFFLPLLLKHFGKLDR